MNVPIAWQGAIMTRLHLIHTGARIVLFTFCPDLALNSLVSVNRHNRRADGQSHGN